MQANLILVVKVKLPVFEIIRDLYMINTNLKFEAKVPNGSKTVAFTRNCTKFLSLKANLTLKVKVKITTFQTRLRYLDNQ